DLDIEQDEQHRHEVKADPEAEPPLDLGRKPALIRLLLGAVRTALTEKDVQNREQCANEPSQNEEHDRWQVVTEHDESLYHRIEIACNKVLLSAEYRYLRGARTGPLYP